MTFSHRLAEITRTLSRLGGFSAAIILASPQDRPVELFMSATIDVVLPAHNEGESIGLVLKEFYKVVATEQGYPIRFIVCEDGSRQHRGGDPGNGQDLPVVDQRKPCKGYPGVIDGFRPPPTAGQLYRFRRPV